VDGRENETVEGRESPGKDESSTFTVCAAILGVGYPTAAEISVFECYASSQCR
jgi:hypothetical protein